MSDASAFAAQDAALTALAKELVKEARLPNPSRHKMHEILQDMIATQRHTDLRSTSRARR